MKSSLAYVCDMTAAATPLVLSFFSGITGFLEGKRCQHLRVNDAQLPQRYHELATSVESAVLESKRFKWSYLARAARYRPIIK